MNHSLADKIARAVLYEGYILYPYRPSVKTRQRWTFGGLYPPAFSEAQNGTDPAVMQTQCLAAGDDPATLEAEVRFLHLMDRRVGRFAQPLDVWPDGDVPAFTEVPSLDVDGKLYQPWQEATERTVQLPPVRLADLTTRTVTVEFAMPASRTLEPIRQGGGGIVGVLERMQQAVTGAVELSAEFESQSSRVAFFSLPRYCCSESELTASSRHPIRRLRAGSERSEGSLLSRNEEILRCAQDDKHLRACSRRLSSFTGELKAHGDSGGGLGKGLPMADGSSGPSPLPSPGAPGEGDNPEGVARTPNEPSDEPAAAKLYRVTVRISNQTPLGPAAVGDRDEALLRSLISTHTLLGIEGGRWVSLTDPPAELKSAAEACRNIGAWPVLVGQPGATDTILSSPIILGDYPQVAPESPGDLFDSSEIDEILTLRIMTLTDEEKRAMTGIDERAAALLTRTESLAREQLMALHGTIRACQPILTKGRNE